MTPAGSIFQWDNLMQTTIYEIIIRKFSSRCFSFKFVGGHPTSEDVLAAIEQNKKSHPTSNSEYIAEHSREIVKMCGLPKEGGKLRTSVWQVLGSSVGSIEIRTEEAWEVGG